MDRIIPLLLAFPLVACGVEARDPEPVDVDEPAAASAPQEGVGDTSTTTSSAPEAPAVCGPEGRYAVAPEGSPVCSADVACDSDADCAHIAGTYCLPAFCAFAGCLRGACLLTKVMGQACSRDAECVSEECDCGSGDCVCAPEQGEGTFRFP